MTTPADTAHGVPSRHGPGGNEADRAYLVVTELALTAAVLVSDEVSRRGAPSETRSLARGARADQLAQLDLVTARLGDRSGQAAASTIAAGGQAEARVSDADFVAHLVTWAEVAIATARTEMIAGCDPVVRALAQDDIRVQSRRLSALG